MLAQPQLVVNVDHSYEFDLLLVSFNPIIHGGGHLVPGSFSYCDFQNFSIATASSNFVTFPRNI